jgi:hypothetical protein
MACRCAQRDAQQVTARGFILKTRYEKSWRVFSLPGGKPLQRRWVLAPPPARCRGIADQVGSHQATASTHRRQGRLPQEPGGFPPQLGRLPPKLRFPPGSCIRACGMTLGRQRVIMPKR